MKRLLTLSLSLFTLAGIACDVDTQTRTTETAVETGERERGGKADKQLVGSCEDSCGTQALDGNCYCDAKCSALGDCCEDFDLVCEDEVVIDCPDPVMPPPDFCPPGEVFSWVTGEDGCLDPSCDPIPPQACAWDQPCGEGEYCHFEQGQACGATQELGECREIPQLCTKEFMPVCGCDGEVYGNECMANAAGESAVPAAQGSDGFVCPQLFDKCDADHPCGEGTFCNWAPNEACGDGTGSGICIPQPEACTKELNPVCGCDGEVYGNPCEANAAGLSWVPAAQSSNGFICPSLDDTPPPPAGSCQGECGGAGSDGTCWCDDQCAELGDCCEDKADVCG